MTQTTTQIINITPVRITCEHYQTQSFTRTDKTYNQHFDYGLEHWTCNCPNYTIQKNLNCKHLILLRAFISREKSQAAPEQKHHSSSTELIQILTRIAKLENSVSSLETEQYHVERDLDEHNFQLDTRSEQEVMLKGQITKQQEQLDYQRELIAALQTSVCRLNERTINQDESIKQLLAAMAEQQRAIDDQAQQINKLHEQISSQSGPSEQVVRVVIEQQPAVRVTRQQSDEPAAMEIREVRNDKGKLVACKVGKFTVKVSGTCAGSCDCSTGLMDKQCPHMVKVDQFLSK